LSALSEYSRLSNYQEVNSKKLSELLIKLILQPSNEIVEYIGRAFDIPALIKVAAGKRYIRGIPPIRFEKFKTARSLYEKLLSDPEKWFTGLRKLDEGIISQLEKLIREDKTFYTFCLYMAVIFSTFSLFRRAIIFAKQAVLIGDEEYKGGKESFIDGREAYYLLSYILRLLSKTRQGLEYAEGFLKEAIKRYQNEKEITESYELEDLPFDKYIELCKDDLRFPSLHMSFEVNKFLFEKYLENESEGVDLKQKAEEIIKNLEKLLGEVESILQKDSGGKNVFNNQYELRIVQRHVLTNLLIMNIEYVDLTGEKKEEVSKYITELENNLSYESKPENKYVRFILKVAKCIFENSCIDVVELEQELYNYEVFPYDEDRLERYMEIIKLLSKQGKGNSLPSAKVSETPK